MIPVAAFAALAVAWWGNGTQPPCGTPVPVVTDQTVMRVESGVPLTDPLAVFADANAVTCAIHYDGWLYPRLTQGAECRAVFHEVGHLFGFQHTPTGIMSAELYDGPFSVCDDFIKAMAPKPGRFDHWRHA